MGESDEHGSGLPADPGGEHRPTLRAVDGPLGPAEPLPGVRLHREFKGLTVLDLMRDELVARLPGQVRSALRHIERGDFAAAERALPGEWAPVLPGPGRRRRRWLLPVAVLAAAVAGGLVLLRFL
jgi:hypothetical protein